MNISSTLTHRIARSLLWFICVVILFCIPALSQSTAPQTQVGVTSNVVKWETGTSYSDSTYLEGQEVKSIYSDGLTISVIFVAAEKNIDFLVYVKNNGEQRVLVDPKLISLNVIDPKPVILASLDPEKVAHSAEHKGRFRGALGAGLAGMATRQRSGQITDNQGNTATVTTTEPDYDAQRRANENVKERKEHNRQTADNVRASSLKANTLFTGADMIGHIYFEHKKYDTASLSLMIGNKTYEFPYAKPEKK